MDFVVRKFAEGGAAMYLVTLLTVAGLVLAILALVRASDDIRPPRLQWIALIGALPPILVGYGGYRLGLMRVLEALAAVDPGMREQLLLVGTAEALVCLKFGAICSALLGLLAGGALALVYGSSEQS